MKSLIPLTFIASTFLFFSACKKDNINTNPINGEGPQLVFKFKFDSTQVRLNNFGQPSTIPAGRAAQSPIFRKMSAHYVELAPAALTALGQGEVLYHAKETELGGAKAIDFDSSLVVGEGETFLSVALKSIKPGTYTWLRTSLAYQNYDVKVKFQSNFFTGRVASFLGYNTYVRTYKINTLSQTINSNKLQGYWAFEAFGLITSGQAPAGATTVVNPLFNTSPVPAGSCVVTGQFDKALTITGNETKDIVITVSLSTNKSFEWVDNGDNIYEPSATEYVIDMGVRGMIPLVNY
jgi:hypothetical protein